MERAEQLAGSGSWDWDLETDELRWSDNVFRLLGLEVGEITPTPDDFVGLVHPDDRERVVRELLSARERGNLPDAVYRVRWPDGTGHVLRAFSTAAQERQGRPSRIVGCVQDITELSAAQRQAAQSLTLIETLEALAPVGFAFVDRDFRIVRINKTLAEAYGSRPEDQIGCSIAELVPDVWSQMEPACHLALESGTPILNAEVERERSAEHDRRYWLASYVPVGVADEVVGVGVVMLDVTERQEAEHLRAAVMDTMLEGLFVLDHTGCLTLMNAAAAKILGWSEHQLYGKSMHDAIHFQHSDGSPHAQDECEMLKVSTQGRPVRMNHDAFTRKDGTICPVAYSAAPLRTGPASGVVVVFRDTSADEAEEDRVRRQLDTLTWVGRIREALDEGRMTLYSQPILPLAGGQPSQELLLRMIGRNGEIVPPGSFLPVAEKYGLIGEIDRWVISHAVRLAANGERVEANLSAESIGNLDLLPLIDREVRRSGADASNITFEITETALMANLEAGELFARGLSRIGCQVALDDFGTGFGSFTYLKTLPITYLKIDIDFVRDLTTNTANQHLVKAIVSLAHDFGYMTIGEGVEDAETLELIKTYGADFAQGFHTGPPAPLAAF
jgi:PAS domain S-box-containing protein